MLNFFIRYVLIVFFAFLFLDTPLFAFAFSLFKSPYSVEAGPMVYHSRRLKEGGSQQTGTLAGGFIGFDHIRKDSLYIGAEGSWANGKMYGHTGGGSKLKSNLTDREVEGRIGYTFQRTKGTKDSLSLFGGYGYFNSTNKFLTPSPMTLQYRNSFTYYVFGFIASATFHPRFKLGVNFKVQFMEDGESKITDDPTYQGVVLKMANKPQYQSSIPFTYIYSQKRCHFESSFVPFLIYRHFGGRENFPFDFVDTKYQIFGAAIRAAYVF